MKVRDIKDARDLRDMSTGDAMELLDELRAIFTKSATDLVGQGRTRARRALGVPDQGAVAIALIGGIVAGVIVGAAMALIMSPFSGKEARRKLIEQVDRVRERMPETVRGGNGQAAYPHPEMASPVTGAPAAQSGSRVPPGGSEV